MHQVARTIFHHRSGYECGECKEGSVHLTLTLTTIFCRCQQTVQLPPVPKPIQLKQTTYPKTAKKCFKGYYITTMYFALCIVCCVVYCLLCITVQCCVSNQMQFCQQNLFIFHKNINIYFESIIKCFFVLQVSQCLHFQSLTKCLDRLII